LLTRGFRLLGLIAIVGFILSLLGGINGTSTNPSEINQAKTLRHIGSILFAMVYGFLVAVHIGCWLCARRLTKAHRTVCDVHSQLSLRVLTHFLHSCSSLYPPPCHSSAFVSSTRSYQRTPARPYPPPHRPQPAHCQNSI
jgi:hypothetical protein